MNLKRLLKKEVPAPLWKRVFAYLIDLLIINTIIVLPFQPIMEKTTGEEAGTFSEVYKFLISHPEKARTILLISIAIAILTILYFAIFEYKLQQSIGKMFFRIFVKSKAKTKKLLFSQCFIRSITKISLLPLALDCLYMFYTKKNQRYFEKISNTEVIDKSFVGVKLR